ncbi:hypothetical protein [Duganella violaceipulchra]|uniref:Uncharacterized protein n=1 Tax=Duganella violaceipulchra TaxID=2849652 RepID=A0AA41L587_9BURK|nr:hypothetical protein [Duganella violaceicalia]MBV6321927.1 hypothetical protein [Duganella violaceicalia]MCP2007079.1 hypothetical protein [Duganella violaceicalia]
MTRRHALTDTQVREVFAAHQSGVRGAGYQSLARRFGVGVSTIRDILTCRSAYATGRCAPSARATAQGAAHA